MANRLLINYIAEPVFDQDPGISLAHAIGKHDSAWRPNLDLVFSDAVMVYLPIFSGNLLWKILDKYGHDPEPVFFEEGVRKEMLFEEEKRISLHHINRLWIKAARLIEDPCFGLEASGFWHPSYFGALGYAWLASTTLRKALERLDRYIHIISEKIDIKLEERKDGLNLIIGRSSQGVCGALCY